MVVRSTYSLKNGNKLIVKMDEYAFGWQWFVEDKEGKELRFSVIFGSRHEAEKDALHVFRGEIKERITETGGQ